MTSNRTVARIPLSIGVLLAALLLGPLTLHVLQKRHNILPFRVAEMFPADKAIVSGEVFASTVIAIMEHELSGPTGWRPNDFVLWGHRLWADNNANRQLGTIQAIRESTRVLKDNLTKVSPTTYDTNLVSAETAFRNDATKFWLPSAENKFREGIAALREYVRGLKTTPPTSKPLNRRNVELIRLFMSWTDLLGDAHANLFKQQEDDGTPLRMWRTDDYFYHAQGFAHVIQHLALAVKREYESEFVDRPTVVSLLDEVAGALGQAATLKPLIVLDSSPAGLFANHRRNLDAYVVEARQKMYSIREELEK